MLTRGQKRQAKFLDGEPKVKIPKREKVVKTKHNYFEQTAVSKQKVNFEEELELVEVMAVMVKEMEEVVESMEVEDDENFGGKVEVDPDLFIRPDGLPITFAMLRRDSEESRSWFKLSLLFKTFPKKYKKSLLRTFDILPTIKLLK